MSTGIVSGPFRDSRSSDQNIFGKDPKKRQDPPAPLESYLAKTAKTSVSLSGAELASRAFLVGHVCSNLQEIVVILNFSSSTWPPKKSSPHSESSSFFDTYATPSNLELTIGTATVHHTAT